MSITVNMAFGYYAHLNTGVLAAMGGAKYFLPIWPMAALAAARGATSLRSVRKKQVATVMLVGVMLVSYLNPFVAGVSSLQAAPVFNSFLPDLKPRKAP